MIGALLIGVLVTMIFVVSFFLGRRLDEYETKKKLKKYNEQQTTSRTPGP